VLLQSKSVLTRPWVILEIYTAITHGVPVVALNVQNANPYEYGAALDFLYRYDEEIEIGNPRAAQLLLLFGVDPQDVAYRLSEVIPSIISTDFNPNASAAMLGAMMTDLKRSIERAVPLSPALGKDEWLSKRASARAANGGCTRTAVRILHGSDADTSPAGPVDATDAADAAAVGAAIPPTVPELPAAYLPRPTDLEALKAALLNQAMQTATKTCAFGMGGVGKTTIAASLVYEHDVRSSFDTIAWVSLGQEPSVRELQNSIHFQLCKHDLPEQAKEQHAIFQALKDAAAGTNILLVLDDVWESAMEKPFNCIDPTTPSRLFVTTRIRGLLKHSAEVELGVLPADDALNLLLASASREVDASNKEHELAVRIVELCGRLPLTLAIAGGMVSDVGQGFTDDILDAMKESHGADLEDGGGLTLEERVISSSLKMITGKNKALVVQVFNFFAVFPEDVAVPAGVFNALAPLISGMGQGSKARLAVGCCLGKLTKFNLLKGSIARAGLFAHDIVRDYTTNQHTEAELRALQRDVVDAVLVAKPADGFDDYAHRRSFHGYVVRQLHWHIRGALADGEEPPEAWLSDRDQDPVVKLNAAVAFGLEKLKALSAEKEAAGQLVHAAQIAWEASFLKQVSPAARADLVYRAAGCL
jgi:hypothetical protein